MVAQAKRRRHRSRWPRPGIRPLPTSQLQTQRPGKESVDGPPGPLPKLLPGATTGATASEHYAAGGLAWLEKAWFGSTPSNVAVRRGPWPRGSTSISSSYRPELGGELWEASRGLPAALQTPTHCHNMGQLACSPWDRRECLTSGNTFTSTCQLGEAGQEASPPSTQLGSGVYTMAAREAGETLGRAPHPQLLLPRTTLLTTTGHIGSSCSAPTGPPRFPELQDRISTSERERAHQALPLSAHARGTPFHLEKTHVRSHS